MKRTKNSRYMHMIFNVQSGTVEVRVHENEFTVHKQGVWQVPRGTFFLIIILCHFSTFSKMHGSMKRPVAVLLHLLPCMQSLQQTPIRLPLLSPSLYDSRCIMLDAIRVFAYPHLTPHLHARVVRSCSATWHDIGGNQGRVRQATRASEHTGEANPILVTRMGVALTAACCVTIDAKALPNRRCTTLSFACSCGGYQTCSKPSGKERQRKERGYSAPQTRRHNKPASPIRLRSPTPVLSFRFANSPALEAVSQPSLRVALTLPLFPCLYPFLALSLVQKHTQLTSGQSQ